MYFPEPFGAESSLYLWICLTWNRCIIKNYLYYLFLWAIRKLYLGFYVFGLCSFFKIFVYFFCCFSEATICYRLLVLGNTFLVGLLKVGRTVQGREGERDGGMPAPAGCSVRSVLKAVCYAGRRLWAFEGLNTIFWFTMADGGEDWKLKNTTEIQQKRKKQNPK